MSDAIKLPGAEIERAAANVLERAGSNLVDASSGFASNVFNGLIGDKVREWRNQNMIHAAAETAKILEKCGVSLESTKGLPILEFYSIFKGASEQDDQDVMKLWAGLLASRMSPGTDSKFDKHIVQTLSILNGTEAKILKFLRESEIIASELYKTMPKIEPALIDEDKILYYEKIQHKRNEIVINIQIGKDAIYDAIFATYSDNDISDSTRSLCVKGLIFPTVYSKSHRNLVKSEYISTDFGSSRVEVLDAAKIVDALDDLRAEALGSSKVGKLKPLFAKNYAEAEYRSIAYELTDGGSYLLDRCTLKPIC